MLNVVCINAGNYEGRGVQYVTTLNDMVRRNLPEGYPGRFTVFTDSLDNYGPEIERRDLPCAWLDGWWHKLSLFKPGVFERGSRVLFLDLDTLLTGRIDSIANYAGDFAILRDFYREGWQSSVMAWTVSERTERIWTRWIEEGSPMSRLGDQGWIEQSIAFPDIWQDMLPDAFVSYKLTQGYAPEKASVVVFHGHPRPHQVPTGWVPQVWKEGGITRAELDQVCNTALEEIKANVMSACSRDLPWFDFQWTAPRIDYQVCVVGGSPSLKDSLDELRRRRDFGQQVWALNGSFDYLMSQGIRPDAHVIIDARAENAAFVQRPIKGVRYFIASQCHPDVFDALEGYDVTLIHCQSEGMEEWLSEEKDRPLHLLGAGTTVAMKAMLIAELQGAGALHLIGMDSCYQADEHHAYRQDLNNGELLMDLIYGDRTFRCAPWMIGQAQDFIDYASRYEGVITVAGDGLLAHIAREGVPETAADVRAREIASRLPEGPIQGAEIGVFAADLSRRLLRARNDLKLHLVDSWGDYDDSLRASGDYHATLTDASQEEFYARTKSIMEGFQGRAVIHRAKSVSAARKVPDELDFVFIDADHSYEGCRSDLEAWGPKVRPGGLLSGHDYDNSDYPQWGVKRAVDEYVAAKGLQLELGENFTWFVRTQGD